MMNMLFLDIDGVLNSARFLIATNSHSYPTADPKDCILDEVAVKLLQKVYETCELEIYIHSSWWSDDNINANYFRQVFKKYGWLDVKICGGNSSFDRVARILKGLDKFKPEKFIILDDANLQKEFGDNYCQVDNWEGFGYKNYVEILTHFSKKDKIKYCLL